MAIFTEQEYKSRISALQKELASKQIDIALFSQTTELYYYSGSNLPLYCIIPAQGQPFLIARKGSPRIREECRHMPLEIFGNSKDLIAIFKKHFNNKIKKCGFVLDASSYSTVIRMLKLLDKPEAVDISWDTKMLRTIKSESEIAIQRKAGVIISKIPEVIRNNYHPGITELELSAHIEFYLRVNGAGSLNCRQESIVLAPGVLSAGINSLVPNKFDGICSGAGLSNALPFGGNDECIPPNTSIICDYGFVLEGYHVDMTRMFSVANPPEEALKAMDAMLSVEKLVIDSIKPGVTWESLWAIAEISATELGYKEQFMGIGPEKVKFVGHGLGLYLDEPPFLAPKMPDIIKENMVIAVEPKVALPGIGVVGIEDTILVTEQDTVCLTECPKSYYIL